MRDIQEIESMTMRDPRAALAAIGPLYADYRVAGDECQVGRLLRCQGICQWMLGRSTHAIADLETAYRIFEANAAHAEAVRTAIILARLEAAQGATSRSIEWLESTRRSAESANDPDSIAEVASELGDRYATLNDMAGMLKSYRGALASLERFDGVDGVEGNAVVLLSIGRVMHRLGDLEAASRYLHRALDVSRATGRSADEVAAITALAAIYLDRNEPARAEELALTGLTIYEFLGDREGIVATLVTLGDIACRAVDTERMFEFYLRAFDVLDDGVAPRLRVAVLLALGRAYRESGDLSAAQFLLEQALGIARGINDRHAEHRLHEALSATYEQLGDLRRALEHHRHHARIRQEMAGEEKQKEVAALQVRFDIEQAEREREINRQRAERAEAELQNEQNKLAAMMRRLGEKSELISALKEKIKRCLMERSPEYARVLREMQSDLDVAASSDHDLDALTHQVGAVYPGFIAALLERNPSLSMQELTICSLIKIKRSSKEIASILCIGVRTVETHRLNIRRKLDLPEGTNLATFIIGL